MQIAVVTDVHFHLMWFERYVQFVEMLTALKPDLLIMAGDVGEPLDVFDLALRFFQPVCENRAALAGNHDVWHRESPHDSKTLWETELAKSAARQGYHWLERENLIFDSLGICGSIAWYDYGAKAPDIEFDEDEYERLKPLISNDGKFIDWPWTDREFAAMMVKEMGIRLEALEQDDSINDILVVTHVPLFNGMQRSLEDPDRSIADAYYGNTSMGEHVMQAAKVRMILSGHVHLGRHRQIERDELRLAPINTYTNPADYGEPAGLLLDTDTWEVTSIKPDYS